MQCNEEYSVQCSAVQCSAVLCCAVLCCAVLCCAVQCSALLPHPAFLPCQSVRTAPMVLDAVLPAALEQHEEVWIITGTGHHTDRAGLEQGGRLERPVWFGGGAVG